MSIEVVKLWGELSVISESALYLAARCVLYLGHLDDGLRADTRQPGTAG